MTEKILISEQQANELRMAIDRFLTDGLICQTTAEKARELIGGRDQIGRILEIAKSEEIEIIQQAFGEILDKPKLAA
jgi:ribosomal protein L17